MNKDGAIKDIERRLGYTLKGKQYEAVRAIRSGKDTFVIAGPGFGKSGIFHTAGLLEESKLTIVVEPTISLIVDQVRHLSALEQPASIACMTLHNTDEHKNILQKVKNGEITFLFVTPERLQQDSFRKAVSKHEPWLLAIDECHLIMDWGTSFRPDYLKIGGFMESLSSRPVVLAMTATAPQTYRGEIKSNLLMEQPKEIITSIDKPNLSIIVEDATNHKQKGRKEHLIYMLKRVQKNIKHHGTKQDGSLHSTIVYCLTPDDVEVVANFLRPYYEDCVTVSHGKLSKKARAENEMQFLTGEKPIIVASSAFGQGVDKADIRLIIHLGLPLSPVDYYQQIGRGGRDGGKAKAVVIYDKGWMKKNAALIQEASKGSRTRMRKAQKRLEAILKGDKCIMTELLKELGENREKPCNHCTVCQKRRRKK